MECIESRFQITTPTDLENLSGLSLFSAYQICLAVGETCGLPRANTVRPYKIDTNFLMRSSLSRPFLCIYYFTFYQGKP